MRRHVSVPRHAGIYWSETAKGKVYEVAYTDSFGKRRFKTTGPLLKEALAFQADIRLKLRRGEKVNPTRITFGEVAAQWEARLDASLAPATVEKYKITLRNRLIPRFGSVPVQKITPDMIVEWLGDLRTLDDKKELGSSAKQSCYIVLQQVLAYAANSRRGYIPSNPCDSLEKGERPTVGKKQPRVFTPEESVALLAQCPSWLNPIVQTAMLTGMRAGEIIGLKWSDVDFNTNMIRVSMQLTQAHQYLPAKNSKGKPREIEMLPALRKTLYSLPSRFSGGWVFQSASGGAHWYDHVRREFRAACDRAGISTDLTLHTCRHTFASALLQDGKDVAWVSGLLGHKSIQTTLDTYTHVINKQNRTEDAAVRLSEAFGGWAR